MTKKVIVINADTAAYNLKVKVVDVAVDGTEHPVSTTVLEPSKMGEFYIHGNRRIIVDEVAQ